MARLFQKSLELHFKVVLKSSINTLGGKILCNAIKIEFQMRGSPHAHMLIWVSPDVKLTEQTVPIFIEYIDKIVSADIPEEKSSTELVKNYQTHRHTKTCKKWDTFCNSTFQNFQPQKQSHLIHFLPNCCKAKKDATYKAWWNFGESHGTNAQTENGMNISVGKMLSNAQVEMKNYYWALQVAPNAFFQIPSRRTVSAININSYNRTYFNAFSRL